jgi:L-seryl-tRNA(Ser) seleniumtransferase
MFSGDKLLGGPQAGIIAGKKDLIARIRRHPLFRALRVDKLTIAALETTLSAYLRSAWDEIPAMRMLHLKAEEIQERAENLVREILSKNSLNDAVLEIVEGTSLVGGGSTPSQSLPTRLIRITSSRYSAAKLEERLRRTAQGPPIIARVEDDALLLDLRTVLVEQESQLATTVAAALL